MNGATVSVPVKDDRANLIPLPAQTDPNAVLAIDLQLAARSKAPERVTIATPIVAAPVMLAEWKLEPDTAQRLVYRQGSLTPVGGVARKLYDVKSVVVQDDLDHTVFNRIEELLEEARL